MPRPPWQAVRAIRSLSVSLKDDLPVSAGSAAHAVTFKCLWRSNIWILYYLFQQYFHYCLVWYATPPCLEGRSSFTCTMFWFGVGGVNAYTYLLMRSPDGASPSSLLFPLICYNATCRSQSVCSIKLNYIHEEMELFLCHENMNTIYLHLFGAVSEARKSDSCTGILYE